MNFDAVLFDCDGVLVDSEPLTNGVLHDMLQAQGWALSAADCLKIFVGKALVDELATIEAHTGKPVTKEWLAEFRVRRNAVLMASLQAMPGAVDTVSQIQAAYQGRVACASGADRFKVEMQLEKCGLMPFFKDRVFSGHEMPRSKPFPDVYLAAAAALGVAPERCAVVEDSLTGVTAGVAAGCTVFGYSPVAAGQEAAQMLRSAGAVQVFDHMADLPALLRG